MKRFLSQMSFVAALILTSVAFGGSHVSGKVESVGPRGEQRVVYRPVQVAAPYALTGESRVGMHQKLVRQEAGGGMRDRGASFRWVDAK